MYEQDEKAFLVLNPKLALTFIAAATVVSALFCILALLTGDVRLQGNGYNLATYRLTTIVGSFGVVIGFVGMLGIWDSHVGYLRYFARFLFLKVACMLAAMICDFVALCACDGFMFSAMHFSQHTFGHLGLDTLGNNPQIEKLSEAGLCPRARAAYALGCVVDLGAWLYFLYLAYWFLRRAESGVTSRHPIEFSSERYDRASRWSFFNVTDPRTDAKPRSAKRIPTIKEEVSYGSMGPLAPDGAFHQDFAGPPGTADLEGGPETYDISTHRSGPATLPPTASQRTAD